MPDKPVTLNPDNKSDILEPIFYGWHHLQTSIDDAFTPTEYTWKQVACSVVVCLPKESLLKRIWRFIWPPARRRHERSQRKSQLDIIQLLKARIAADEAREFMNGR